LHHSEREGIVVDASESLLVQGGEQLVFGHSLLADIALDGLRDLSHRHVAIVLAQGGRRDSGPVRMGAAMSESLSAAVSRLKKNMPNSYREV
jgi:hypothetical protein